MVGSHWLIGMLAGAMLLHALVVYRAYRHRRRDQSTGSAPVQDETDLIDVEEGEVECPQCGTTNESGYRYCRSCVTELPMTMEFEQSSDSPLGRVMR